MQDKNNNLLGTFQVAVDDFVQMQIVHARGDLHGPVDREPGRNGASAVAQQIVQRPVRTVLLII